MEVKKAIKKVVALAAGATMMGATMMGALAADLSTYPAPFVKDGKFDAFIVVGDKAAAEDVVGAVDIGASLQFEMKKEEFVSTGTDAVLISDGVKIKGTGSEVQNYGETLGEVRTTALDDRDLPVLLAEGRYQESQGATKNDEIYTQELILGDLAGNRLNGLAMFTQPEDLKAGNYLELNDVDVLYTYRLQFDNPVEYELAGTGSLADDIEGSQIELQGNLYTITNVKFDATNLPKDMTLMAGDTLVWLMQDQVIEKTINGVRHEIKVVDVTTSETSCGVSVDGHIAWIDVRTDRVVNGVNIGVLDAKAVHAQLQDVDICQLNIGSTEIRIKNALDNGDATTVSPGQLYVDGDEIRGANVELLSDAAGKWAGLVVEYTPLDNIYLADGQEWVDPALDNFKIVFGDTTKTFEEINIDRTSTKKGRVRFVNNDGKLVELPMFIDTTTSGSNMVKWGNGETKPLLFEGTTLNCPGTAGTAKDCKNVMLYAITSGNSAHVVEITNVDTGLNTVDLRDLTYGRTWSGKSYMLADAPISLGSLGSLTLDLESTPGTLDVSAPGSLVDPTATVNNDWMEALAETKNGGWIAVYQAGILGGTTTDENSLLELNDGIGNDNGYCEIGIGTPAEDEVCEVIYFLEDDGLYDDNTFSTAPALTGVSDRQVIMTTVVYDSLNDKRLEFQTPVSQDLVTSALDEWHADGIIEEDGSSIEYYVTFGGTKVKYNSDSQAYVTIWYPNGQVDFNAFVAPISAQLTATGGDISTITLERLNVGAARLASEVTVGNDNLILVGGACANAATAEVQDLPYNAAGCEAGLSSGEAIIKLYDLSGGKVAMVVAGMDALDTRRATRVVANFKAYKLSGMEAKVTGTTLTDIKVSVPS